MKKIKIILTSMFCFLISGCGSKSIDYYESRKEKIDMREFFNGEIEGWGALFDIWGNQTRSFYVHINGSWDGNKGVLDEKFDFDDGEKQTRKWDVYFENESVFKAKALDIIGDATGIQKGNAVNLNYILEVPYKNSTINLSMDDWMYKIQDNAVVNKTSMKKFGIKVGELVLIMKKKK